MYHLLEKYLKGKKVSFTAYYLLRHLLDMKKKSVEMLMRSVAQFASISTAAATGLVDGMEKEEYVTRTLSLEDRRKRLVRITPKGHELVSEFDAYYEQNRKECFLPV